MSKLSRFPSLARRRSHLDSASYRTLIQIFSLCESLLKDPNPPSADRNPSFNLGGDDEGAGGGESYSGDCGHELQKDQTSPNPRFCGTLDGLQIEEQPLDAKAETLGEWSNQDRQEEHDGTVSKACVFASSNPSFGGILYGNFGSVEKLQQIEEQPLDANAKILGESGNGDRNKEHDGCEDGGVQKDCVLASSNPCFGGTLNGKFESVEKLQKIEGQPLDAKSETLEESRNRDRQREYNGCEDGAVQKDCVFARSNPTFGCTLYGNFDSVEKLQQIEEQFLDAKAETLGEPRNEDRKEHDGCEDGAVQKDCIFVNRELEQAQLENLVEESKTDECAHNESLGEIVLDFPELDDGLDEMVSSLEEFMDCTNGGPRENVIVIHSKSHDSFDTISSLLDDSSFGKRQQLEDGRNCSMFPTVTMARSNELGDEIHGPSEDIRDEEIRPEEHTKCFNSEVAKEMATETTTEKIEAKEYQPVKEISEELPEERHNVSDSVTDCSMSGNIVEQQISPLMGSENNEIEEGEISDEEQILENQETEKGSIEINCNVDLHNFPISDKNYGIEQAYRDDISLTLQTKEVSIDVFKACSPKPKAVISDVSESEDVKCREKKKRGPLTEERKAKKKKAKKRKRAQKEREQGVKRLKLQPNVKPKEVKLCKYFMIGRCQQGGLCKYSHDTTPLTKSQPCKYFACDSCLKGDDCAFDHQLSKYPCHNFMSNGMCSRGHQCKFSHEKSVIESSSMPSLGKAENQLDTRSNPLNADGSTKKCSKPSMPLTVNQQFEMNSDPSLKSIDPLATKQQSETNMTAKYLKEPLKIPKGIRFLSFGNGLSDGANKLKHKGIVEDGHSKALASEQKTMVELPEPSESSMKSISRSVCHPAANASASKGSKSSSFNWGPVAAPFSKTSLQADVSEASKILDEFLFGGLGG